MTYGDKVYKFLNELPPGARVKIDYSKPWSKEFVELVKEYIQVHDYNYGNGIEFNHDYTVVKKAKYSHLFDRNN